MLEENKKPNPLGNNSDDPWNLNTSGSWKLEDTLAFLGWATIIVGSIVAFYMGTSLEAVEVSYSTAYDVPHPMRWLYAAGVFMSSLCSGALMLGVGRTLKYLEEIKSKLN